MGYQGYDTGYDDEYHERSAYFYIKRQTGNSNDVLLVMRITDADKALPFPFENGSCVRWNSAPSSK